MKRNGYQVLTAVGLREAGELLKQQTPHMIVMNCELPDGNGITACRVLREKKLPVRVLLTSNDREDEVYALDAGADDFVKKPYHVDVLLARMKRLQA